MSATVAPGALLERSDAALITAVRAGDLESYGELFARHGEAARRLARQLTRGSGDAEDLVSDAFAKVMEVLRRGGGPDEAFRAYVLTAVRRLHVDRTRVTARAQPTDDIAALDPGMPFHDTVVAGFENEAAAAAFASLPERWQLVLWHTEVEGAKPAEVAPLLGISPNSVAALAYRAREGLREAFLAAHAARTDDEECRRTQALLGAYVRGNASRRDGGRVERHLEGCRRCTGIYLELVEVNSGLGALLAPLLLGGAATAYVAAATTAAATAAGASAGAGWAAWLLALPGRVRDTALANVPATAAAGVATAVVVGGVVAGLARTFEPETSAREDIAAPPAPAPSQDAGNDAGNDAGDGAGDDVDAPKPSAPRERPGLSVAQDLPGTPVDSTDAPVGGPDRLPQPPADEPTTEPEPEPDPTDEPEPLIGDARASTTLGLTWRVVLDVTSVPDGADGVVRLSSDRPLAALTLDERCSGPATGTASCRLAEDEYRFRVVPVSGNRTTITFELVLDDGTTTSVPVPLT